MRSMASELQSPEDLGPGQPRMELVSERPFRQRRAGGAQPMSAPPLAIAPAPTSTTDSSSTDLRLREIRVAAAYGAMSAIAGLLAVRWILLLSVVGAFALALSAHDAFSATVFAAFCGLVVVPLIWLDHTTRRGKT